MSLKELVGKEVAVLIDARALSCRGDAGASESISAKGCLAKKQPLFSSMLEFETLVYHTHYPRYMGSNAKCNEIKLVNASVNKKYVIAMGISEE